MHTITYYSIIGIGSDKAPVSLKRILNVDISYLPKGTDFVKKILENRNVF